MGTHLRVVGCFVTHQDRFVVLKRRSDSPQPSTWGLPAGKVDEDESVLEAVLRETQEETGICLTSEQVRHLGDFEFHFEEHDRPIMFSTFRCDLSDERPFIKIKEDEHCEFKWVSPEECYGRDDLIHGFHDLLKRIGYIVG